ncbi:MAG: hypothetical protein JRC87_09485 [Deltaproteobacteria bacterium]|nr:hypothetical protein [Deltaproteobacteria bacterium]MBW2659802.1 hypothetical protein [Deltaproteobacteria bacterium]
MSLSRFFKDCGSFQPENILKPDVAASVPGDSSSGLDSPADNFQGGNPDSGKTDSESLNTISKVEHAKEHQTKEVAPPDIGEAIEKAYNEGFQDALREYTGNYQAAEKSLIAMFEQLETLKESVIVNSRQEIREFTLAIAERIVRYSLRNNDNTIIATIDEALQRAVKSEEFNIYIHPDDYQAVLDKSADLIAGISSLKNIVIKQDSSIEKGGAKIESDNCTIDATISGQFDAIREEIIKRG